MDFASTVRGARFFDQQLPDAIKAVERLAKAVERLAEAAPTGFGDEKFPVDDRELRRHVDAVLALGARDSPELELAIFAERVLDHLGRRRG